MDPNPYDLSLLQPPTGGYKQPQPKQEVKKQAPPQQQQQQQPKPIVPYQPQYQQNNQMLDNTYEVVAESDWLKIPMNTYIRWQYKNNQGYEKGGLVMETMITKDDHKKIKVRFVNTPYFKWIDTEDIQSIYRKQTKYTSKKAQMLEPAIQDPDQQIQALNQIINDKDKIINEKQKTINELLKLVENITQKLARK